jgi:hypothetical protein
MLFCGFALFYGRKGSKPYHRVVKRDLDTFNQQMQSQSQVKNAPVSRPVLLLNGAQNLISSAKSSTSILTRIALPCLTGILS